MLECSRGIDELAQWSLLQLSYEWSLIGGTVASNKLVLGTLKFTLNTQVALRRREGNVQGVQTQKTTYANHARKAFRSRKRAADSYPGGH